MFELKFPSEFSETEQGRYLTSLVTLLGVTGEWCKLQLERGYLDPDYEGRLRRRLEYGTLLVERMYGCFEEADED
jgi:hypothetical protein